MRAVTLHPRIQLFQSTSGPRRLTPLLLIVRCGKNRTEHSQVHVPRAVG
jgi:hypothetical protein